MLQESAISSAPGARRQRFLRHSLVRIFALYKFYQKIRNEARDQAGDTAVLRPPQDAARASGREVDPVGISPPLHPTPHLPFSCLLASWGGGGRGGSLRQGRGRWEELWGPLQRGEAGAGGAWVWGLVTPYPGPAWACRCCTLPAPQMVAKFFPPKQKLFSECICLVLVILRMWGSRAPIPIMLTQPPACGNSSPISAPPPLLLPSIFPQASTEALPLKPFMAPQCPQDKP